MSEGFLWKVCICLGVQLCDGLVCPMRKGMTWSPKESGKEKGVDMRNCRSKQDPDLKPMQDVLVMLISFCETLDETEAFPFFHNKVTEKRVVGILCMFLGK